jgi:ribonuclease D
LAGERTFNGRASRTYLDTWWNAIQLGSNTNDLPPLKLPHTGIPNHRIWPSRFPDADARLKAARPVVQAIADDSELPVENLLTPDYLRQLCWSFPELGDKTVAEFLGELGARTWQIQAVAAPLHEALSNVSLDERAESADQ